MSDPGELAGMTKLAPGVYDDGHGGLHADVDAILDALGWPHTAEASDLVMEQIREIGRRHGIPTLEVER